MYPENPELFYFKALYLIDNHLELVSKVLIKLVYSVNSVPYLVGTGGNFGISVPDCR